MTVQELKALRDAGGPHFLLDVREPSEHAICHIDGAVLIPLGQLQSRVDELPKGQQIVVHCKMGGRSAKAVAFLQQAGFTKVHNLTGGVTAWAERIDPKMPKY